MKEIQARVKKEIWVIRCNIFACGLGTQDCSPQFNLYRPNFKVFSVTTQDQGLDFFWFVIQYLLNSTLEMTKIYLNFPKLLKSNKVEQKEDFLINFINKSRNSSGTNKFFVLGTEDEEKLSGQPLNGLMVNC